MRFDRAILFVTSVLLTCFLPLDEAFSITLYDYDVYGSMLAANDQIVVFAIDRQRSVFGITRPWDSSEFCVYDLSGLSLGGDYVIDLTVPRFGTPGSDSFFYSTQLINQSLVLGLVFLRVTMNSFSSCVNPSDIFLNWGVAPYDYSLLPVSTTGDILLYMDFTTSFMLQYSGYVSGSVAGNPWPDSGFAPYAIDISPGGWGVIAGEAPVNGIFVPTLYLISFPSSFTSNSYNYAVLDLWRAPFAYTWQQQQARSINAQSEDYLIYESSVSINNQGDVLFGVQFMNTVFHFYVNSTNPQQLILKSSRISSVTVPSIGFGKSVGWLDNVTAVILANNVSLDYTEWDSSRIEIYDLSGGQQLSDAQAPYSFFPNSKQPMPPGINTLMILMVASYAGSVTFMNVNGQVYIIYPSLTGYFAATSVANYRGRSMSFASPTKCEPGSGRVGGTGGKYLFDTCTRCLEGTYSDGTLQGSVGCLLCNITGSFCCIGAVAQVPGYYLESRSQTIDSSKLTVPSPFNDILLSNMFDMSFQVKCLATAPMFWTLLLITLTLIFLLVMNILLWTGKCPDFQQRVHTTLIHFDLINDGERWVGGLLSFTILTVIIFAALFTNSFLKQYPEATSTAPVFTCDDTLRNSRITPSMKPLGTQMFQGSNNIFTLLAQQQLTVSLTLLNTITNRSVQVSQTVGAIVTSLAVQQTVPVPGVIEVSSTLTSNIAQVTFTISGPQIIGGLRIALQAQAVSTDNLQATEVDFSRSYHVTNRVTASATYFNIELIPLVNETKALAENGVTQFGGVWLPIISADDTQNFIVEEDYDSYGQTSVKSVTIIITQASYYVSRQEEPIIKSVSATFKNIIFTSTCMELFGFAFLLGKLLIFPLCRLIARKIRPKEDQDEAANNDESSDEEKKPEEESESEDEEEGTEQIPLEPGVNEWYMPDVQV